MTTKIKASKDQPVLRPVEAYYDKDASGPPTPLSERFNGGDRLVVPAVVKPPPLKLLETDLRSITRDSDRVVTRVFFERTHNQSEFTWLIFGQTQVRTSRDRPDGRWRLDARMGNGATDFEHDSAYAISLPLVGLQFLRVDYHQTELVAWVDPNCGQTQTDFHVPRPGYNPMIHKDAYLCKEKKCQRHPIVPEGLWTPPFDPELYKLVRGKKVVIHIGPVIPEKE